METLIVQVVVGTPEEIRSGRGETAVTATAAAARIGISESRFRQLIKDGQIASVGKLDRMFLFRETDVERLKLEREASR